MAAEVGPELPRQNFFLIFASKIGFLILVCVNHDEDFTRHT